MKFVYLYSTIKMMHGPINLRFTSIHLLVRSNLLVTSHKTVTHKLQSQIWVILFNILLLQTEVTPCLMHLHKKLCRQQRKIIEDSITLPFILRFQYLRLHNINGKMNGGGWMRRNLYGCSCVLNRITSEFSCKMKTLSQDSEYSSRHVKSEFF